MSAFRVRWRFFWSRRSPRRMLVALALAVVALVALLSLALPASGWNLLTTALMTITHIALKVGVAPVLGVGVALCFALSLILLFMPSWPRRNYVAPVSVYLDAENQIATEFIPAFTEYLIKRLDGRRADLLYFLDASLTATGARYKLLYRVGFRPVDAPHDPTGTGAEKQAVDRELAMHAYERALLGPPKQTFIIVSADTDFVPLIYRLAALGHHVQLWATRIHTAYRVVESSLGPQAFTIVNLSERIPGMAPPQPSAASSAPAPAMQQQQRSRKSAYRKRVAARRKAEFDSARAAVAPDIPAPTSLSEPGEKRLYYAVAETLAARAEADTPGADNVRNGRFHLLLQKRYAPRMASIGYDAGAWVGYWVDHLVALGVLVKKGHLAFPERGATDVEDAARSLFALAQAVARAAARVGATHADGQARISQIAAELAGESVPADETTLRLLRFLVPGDKLRIAPVRYFVRSARALGLLAFDDVPESYDVISHPQLPGASHAPSAAPAAPFDTLAPGEPMQEEQRVQTT